MYEEYVYIIKYKDDIGLDWSLASFTDSKEAQNFANLLFWYYKNGSNIFITVDE